MVENNLANEKARSARVELRVTLSEKKQLHNLSKEAGLTISDWIRNKTIGVKPRLRKPSPDREILLRFLAAFGKAASNLNQLQHSINRKQHKDDFELPISYINHLLGDMKTLMDKLRTVFTHDS